LIPCWQNRDADTPDLTFGARGRLGSRRPNVVRRRFAASSSRHPVTREAGSSVKVLLLPRRDCYVPSIPGISLDGAPTGPVSSPSISTAPVITLARSRRCWPAADASETVAPGAALRHLERAFELSDAVAASGSVGRTGPAQPLRSSFPHPCPSVVSAAPCRCVRWGRRRLGRGGTGDSGRSSARRRRRRGRPTG